MFSCKLHTACNTRQEGSTRAMNTAYKSRHSKTHANVYETSGGWAVKLLRYPLNYFIVLFSVTCHSAAGTDVGSGLPLTTGPANELSMELTNEQTNSTQCNHFWEADSRYTTHDIPCHAQNAKVCYLVLTETDTYEKWITFTLTIYPSGFITAVAVFRKPNAIPLCFSIDLFLNFLFSWLLVLLPSREKLLVSNRAPLQVADRGTLTSYGGYRGNKIPGVDQN